MNYEAIQPRLVPLNNSDPMKTIKQFASSLLSRQGRRVPERLGGAAGRVLRDEDPGHAEGGEAEAGGAHAEREAHPRLDRIPLPRPHGLRLQGVCFCARARRSLSLSLSLLFLVLAALATARFALVAAHFALARPRFVAAACALLVRRVRIRC